MSRSGYSDDCDNWQRIKWRGAVASAIRGKRGQAFLREMLVALDNLPNRRLIEDELIEGEEVCALGAVGVHRCIPGLHDIDPYDYNTVASIFGIAPALAQEIMYENDNEYRSPTPEQRWQRIRDWVESKIQETT